MSRRGRRNAQDEPEQQRYEARVAQEIENHMNRAHFEPVWIHQGFLRESGVEGQVVRMLTASGWPGLLTLSSNADKEDTAEFLATFRYINTDEEHCIQFRHRGVDRRCNMTQLRRVFGWPRGGQTYEPEDQSLFHGVWDALSTAEYNWGDSKARALNDPEMFYLHHILSKTLFAKKNADKVGKKELAVLHLLRIGAVVDWAHYFCLHLQGLRGNSSIGSGGMITFLLRQLYRIPVPPGHTTLHSTYADRVWFLCGKNIQVEHDDSISWRYFSDEALRPPPVERRPRGRPRVVRNQIVEVGEPSHQQQYMPPPQQQPPMHDYARAHIDHMFHMMRSTFLYGQQITMVPAPPGWYPGEPIPPEYMQPHPPGF